MGLANFDDVFQLYLQLGQLPHSVLPYEFTNRDGAKFTEQVLELPLTHRR